LDDAKNRFDWIRAGHEPALLYTPETGAFTELKGSGVALGLDADYPYAANRTTGFSRDQILVLASDGISETRNTKGEMFGKDRLRDLIRSSARESARDITDRIFDAVGAFSKGTLPEDDRTLVVIKRT
jgi:sigma-B regulation protein RsbU (phosphoserine phosphatase)